MTLCLVMMPRERFRRFPGDAGERGPIAGTHQGVASAAASPKNDDG